MYSTIICINTSHYSLPVTQCAPQCSHHTIPIFRLLTDSTPATSQLGPQATVGRFRSYRLRRLGHGRTTNTCAQRPRSHLFVMTITARCRGSTNLDIGRTCGLGRLQTGTDSTSYASALSATRYWCIRVSGAYVVRSEALRLAASFQVAKTSSSIVSATQVDFIRYNDSPTR